RDLPWLDDLVRAKRPGRIPVVLSREEVGAVITDLHGIPRIMAVLLYGAGLRLLECARLRVKDIDFERSQLVIRGKGDRDRVTVLPASVVSLLAAALDRARRQHQADVRADAGYVELPSALARKYPNAAREWRWQWVFPATRTYRYPETGPATPAAPARVGRPGSREGRRPSRRRGEAGHLSHVPALVRDAPPGGWLRHPHRPDAPRSSRRPNDDGVHPRSQSRPGRVRSPADVVFGPAGRPERYLGAGRQIVTPALLRPGEGEGKLSR